MDRLSVVGVPRAGAIGAVIVAGAILAGAFLIDEGRALAAGPGALNSVAAEAAAGGTIVGVVSTKEPAPRPIRATIDPSVCGQTVSIPMPNITLSRPIDKPGIATLTCSTHTWMRGYLHVTDELSAISGADGKCRIDGVPAGTHTLRVWHETLKTSMPVKVTVKDGETVTIDLTLIR